MITIVSGNMRCGSSLVMRMLGAGGMPLLYTQPESFEDERILNRGDAAWVGEADGHALKWLDPAMLGGPPRGFAYRTICLTRDAEQQHRSQVQFLRLLGHRVSRSRAAVEALARDNAALADFWSAYGPVLSLTFENLITQAHGSAVDIAAFVGTGLDVDAMRAQILDRPTRCSEGPLEVDVLPSADLWRGKDRAAR